MAAMIEENAAEYIEALEPPTEPPTPTITHESSEDEGESSTADELKRILEQDEITDGDRERVKIYLRKKKNKIKRNILRQIRTKFVF